MDRCANKQRTRLDAEHDLVISQNGRNWQHATRQSLQWVVSRVKEVTRNMRKNASAQRADLAEHENVGSDAVVIACKHLSGTTEAGLDLISNEKHVCLLADALCLCSGENPT
jgi:hypothetical protein